MIDTEHPGRILVVEDSRTERKILSSIIQKGGYEVVTAEDGIGGLETAITQKPDVILSDIVMPRLTGIEMCRMLKSRDDTRHIPVVFISALDNMDQVVKGLEAGASDYLSKHLDSAQQVLDIVQVNYFQSLRNQFGDGAVLPDQGEESQDKIFLSIDCLELVSFGVIAFSLRQVPIYMNSVARGLFGIAPDLDVRTLNPDVFEGLMQVGVAMYFSNVERFFHPFDLKGQSIEIRMEEIQVEGKGITGLLFLLKPPVEKVAYNPEVAGEEVAQGPEEPLLPD